MPVKLPNGAYVYDPNSPNGYLMAPISDLSNVAAAGKALRQEWKDDLKGTHVRAAIQALYGGLKGGVGHNGDFDYQRATLVSGSLQQLRQFRDVSNFDVGLLGQQAGLSLTEVLNLAGDYARENKTLNYKPNEPYGLDPRTMEWEVIGYDLGERLYGQ